MSEVFGYTLETIGKLMVAYTALAVHHRVRKEHQIDEQVFREMRREMFVGIAGVLFIIIGFIIQLPYKV